MLGSMNDLDAALAARSTIEIRVPWCPETIFFVATEADIPATARRGRYWTQDELRLYLSLKDRTPETPAQLGAVKLALEAGLETVLAGPARRFPGAIRPPAQDLLL